MPGTATPSLAAAAGDAALERLWADDVLAPRQLPGTPIQQPLPCSPGGRDLAGNLQKLLSPGTDQQLSMQQQQQQPAKEQQQDSGQPAADSRQSTGPNACQAAGACSGMYAPADAGADSPLAEAETEPPADVAASAYPDVVTAPAADPVLSANAATVVKQSAVPGKGLHHILLASGTDIPLKLLPSGAFPAGVTLYGSYDYPKDDVADLQEVMVDGMLEAGFSAADAKLWASCLVPHHQWMCLSVAHALVLVGMRDTILKVGAVAASA